MVYSFDQGRGANQPVLVQVNINYCLISEAWVQFLQNSENHIFAAPQFAAQFSQ
jgi:hypothetical protein